MSGGAFAFRLLIEAAAKLGNSKYAIIAPPKRYGEIKEEEIRASLLERVGSELCKRSGPSCGRFPL